MDYLPPLLLGVCPPPIGFSFSLSQKSAWNLVEFSKPRAFSAHRRL